MRCFVYRHRDNENQYAIAEQGASTMVLWLWGYETKPIYALKVKRWKRYV